MIRNRTVITWSSYLSMLTVGVGVTILGAAARDIGLRPHEIGLLLAIEHASFAVAAGISGALADVTSKPRLMVLGSVVFAPGVAALFALDGFAFNAGMMVLVGTGVGLYEGVTDALLLDIHDERQSRYISVNHFFVTAGALVITAVLLIEGLPWRFAMVATGVAAAGVGVVFLLTRVPRFEVGGDGWWGTLRQLPRKGRLAILFTLTAISVGMETATVGCLTTYLVDQRGFSPTAAKVGLLLFLAGIGTGRVLIGLLADDQRITRRLFVLMAVTVVAMTALLGFDLGVLTFPACLLAGLALSAHVPLELSWAGIGWPQLRGTVIGFLKVAIPAGGAVLMFVMAQITLAASFQAALWVIPTAGALGLPVLALAVRAGREDA